MKPVRTADLTHATPLDGRGRRTPATMLALDERDRYLRAAADRFLPGVSDRAAGEMLRKKLLRYRAGAWRRDASKALCPPRHRGTINELLWMTLKARDHVPSEMTIRRALGYS